MKAKTSSIPTLPTARIRLVPDDPGITRPTIQDPASAAEYIFPRLIWEPSEAIWVLCLNTRNVMVAAVEVVRGSINSAPVAINEIFRSAILANSPAIILVHNHPSGDPTPSPEDIAVTRTLVEAGRLLSIDVLDHIIIGRDEHFPDMHPRFVSLKERRLAFN